MALRYGLIPNHLTDDPNDCMAITTDNDTVDIEQIVDTMIGKGSTVTKAEALSVVEEFEYAIVEAVKNGQSVSTELFNISPSVSGVFTSSSDGFDASRHSVRLNLNPGKRLKEAIHSIELKKVEITSPQPVLQQFVNLKDSSVNEWFTPGQIAAIRGSMLKFDEDDAQQGIFFIAADSTETRVTNVVKNKPSELLFFVPEELNSGTFDVEVRMTPHNQKQLKKGRLQVSLTVTN
nr:DNA-binding domain-containing protein [uncultured Carboxylicivirga sp.]